MALLQSKANNQFNVIARRKVSANQLQLGTGHSNVLGVSAAVFVL